MLSLKRPRPSILIAIPLSGYSVGRQKVPPEMQRLLSGPNAIAEGVYRPPEPIGLPAGISRPNDALVVRSNVSTVAALN